MDFLRHKTVAIPKRSILRVNKICADAYFDSSINPAFSPFERNLILSSYNPNGLIKEFSLASLNPWSGLFLFSPTQFLTYGESSHTNTSDCFIVDRIHADIYMDLSGNRMFSHHSQPFITSKLDAIDRAIFGKKSGLIQIRTFIGAMFEHPHTYGGVTHLIGLNPKILNTSHVYHEVYANEYCQFGRCISARIGTLTVQGKIKAAANTFGLYRNETITPHEKLMAFVSIYITMDTLANLAKYILGPLALAHILRRVIWAVQRFNVQNSDTTHQPRPRPAPVWANQVLTQDNINIIVPIHAPQIDPTHTEIRGSY